MIFLVIVVLVIIVGIVGYEQERYKKGRNGDSGVGWQPTDERFIDPETGQRIRVFFNPANGEREYRVED